MKMAWDLRDKGNTSTECSESITNDYFEIHFVRQCKRTFIFV